MRCNSLPELVSLPRSRCSPSDLHRTSAHFVTYWSCGSFFNISKKRVFVCCSSIGRIKETGCVDGTLRANKIRNNVKKKDTALHANLTNYLLFEMSSVATLPLAIPSVGSNNFAVKYCWNSTSTSVSQGVVSRPSTGTARRSRRTLQGHSGGTPAT